MRHPIRATLAVTAAFTLLGSAHAAAVQGQKPAQGPAPRAARVYGVWHIRPRPDKGAEYNRLIERQGLPLFREAGGRMVGWWTTLVGDLYEQVTLWEYDDMGAYEKAVAQLGGSERFKQFAARRDPLLTGEDSRFLRLAPFAEKPALPEPARFVIHEVHRVPLRRMAAYLKFMREEGLPLLKKHGFRPAGPWVVDVGRWSEVTYLFRFDRLAERERLMARFAADPDARTYARVNDFAEDICTRLLVPAPFASPRHDTKPRRQSSSVLPHLERVAPGVYAAGSSDRYHSADYGWVAGKDETLLMDLPRGVALADYLAEVSRTTDRPARTLVLTHAEPGDAAVVRSLLGHGVRRVLTSPEVRRRLLASRHAPSPASIEALAGKGSAREGGVLLDKVVLDDVVAAGGVAVYLPEQGVLFAGPAVANGPRAPLPGTDTGRWVEALRRLQDIGAGQVVPGKGSWGGAAVLARQRRFLAEVRRQVGYGIAQGHPRAAVLKEVRLPAGCQVWMPYDNPTAEDIEHVYQELTVPAAPFNGRPPGRSDPRPHALVLIGDEPHEPGHLEDGLRPALEAAGVVPHFTVDVRALSAENLARVRLLVILRDGLQRPRTGPYTDYVWMTPGQERALVRFVEHGGGLLCLHNALGLYPAGGPYLKLAGGEYRGHGPLERFRVEVVDAEHPVAGGVTTFSVADEQHTPAYDAGQVHLLLRSRSDDGQVAAAGWVREAGRGRVCYLANGHTREALLHPACQRLLRNAVAWCVGRGRLSKR
jgi:type 1 glutamine amidotransferase